MSSIDGERGGGCCEINSGRGGEERGGALSIYLHPLVILTISDHFTRARLSTQEQLSTARQLRVVGALLGTQTGRQVEVCNCFELIAEVAPDGSVFFVDFDFLHKKLDQFKQVFPDYEFLGWYSTGTTPQPSDVEMNKKFLELNESPLLLMFDPAAAYQQTTKELPLQFFESEIHIVDNQPQLVLAPVQFIMASAEAERIGVDHVAHVSKSASSSSPLNTQLLSMHGAIKMLNSRIRVIQKFLQDTIDGTIPIDHEELRKIRSLLSMLPALDTPEFKEEFMLECNDALLVTYLSMLTKTTNTMYDLHEKVSVGYGRQRFHGFL